MSEPFNYFDMLIIGISLSLVFVQAECVIGARSIAWADSDEEYLNLSHVLYFSTLKLYLMALLLILCWIKTLEYLKLNKDLAATILIIGGMAKNVILFMGIMVVFLVAFSSCIYVVFGLRESFSHSIAFTFVDEYRAALGDFDFDGASEADAMFGNLYMIIFSFLVIILLLNLLIAIMSEAYDEVKSTAEARWW